MLRVKSALSSVQWTTYKKNNIFWPILRLKSLQEIEKKITRKYPFKNYGMKILQQPALSYHLC